MAGVSARAEEIVRLSPSRSVANKVARVRRPWKRVYSMFTSLLLRQRPQPIRRATCMRPCKCHTSPANGAHEREWKKPRKRKGRAHARKEAHYAKPGPALLLRRERLRHSRGRLQPGGVWPLRRAGRPDGCGRGLRV